MKIAKTLITIIIIILALFQAPFIYYYCGGLLGVIQVIPYALLGLGLTLLLLYLIRKKKQSSFFHYIGMWIAIIFGIASLFPSEQLIEILDWNFRFDERKRIVEEIKQGKLAPDYGMTLFKLPNNYFPPISVGGNEVAIFSNDKQVKVEFYINRGFLDHYSAFIYTNDQKEISVLDSITKNTDNNNYRKLDANWYRVSY